MNVKGYFPLGESAIYRWLVVAALTKSDLPLSAQIVQHAKDHFGKADALALALKGAGITGQGGHPYTDSSVSKWTKGEVTIPAEVLLTAARLAEIRIDSYLYAPEATSTDQKDLKRLGALEAQMAELTRIVADLSKAVQELRGKRET